MFCVFDGSVAGISCSYRQTVIAENSFSPMLFKELKLSTVVGPARSGDDMDHTHLGY